MEELLKGVDGLTVSSTVDSTVDISDAVTRKDRLKRDHVSYKRTGPLVVCIRNGMFHQLTMEVNLFFSYEGA